MHIDLIRHYKKGEIIDGDLLVKGLKLCDTSENAYTALQTGKYILLRHFCRQYHRFVPVVMNKTDSANTLKARCLRCKKTRYLSNNATLPCICHQLCPGNGIHGRTDGTIQIGTRIVPGCLKEPREPYENLSERIRKISARGTPITINIIDKTQ